jgi:hypothetical protein
LAQRQVRAAEDLVGELDVLYSSYSFGAEVVEDKDIIIAGDLG